MLSDLLWAAFGINRPESGSRTAPSPMNSREIEIYVASSNGVSLYDANFHQLVKLSTEDIRNICGTQSYVGKTPINLSYVANFSLLGDREEDRKLFYAAADTGFISQSVMMDNAILKTDSFNNPHQWR